MIAVLLRQIKFTNDDKFHINSLINIKAMVVSGPDIHFWLAFDTLKAFFKPSKSAN